MYRELSNLPPGVTDNMLPGNRPGDEEREYKKYTIYLSEEEIGKLAAFAATENLYSPDVRHFLVPVLTEILDQIREA